MNITNRIDVQEFVFNAGRTFINQLRNDISDNLERRKKFNQTCHELKNLSDRELDDIGIHRSNIRKIAMEEAYGG